MTGYASEYHVPKQSTVVTQPSVVKFIQRTQYTHIYPPWPLYVIVYVPTIYISYTYTNNYKYIYIYLFICIRMYNYHKTAIYSIYCARIFFETPLKFDEVITQMIHVFLNEIQILMK